MALLHLIFQGDGRNDSPGHCAQYATYTLMLHGTGKIVALEVLDKRVTGGNSNAMEKEALKRAISNIKGKITVTELVTDAHTSIAAMMSKLL